MTNFTKLMFATLIGLLMIGSAAAQNKSNVLGLKTSNTRSEINETFDSGMPDDWTVVDNGSTENEELWHVTDNYVDGNNNSHSLNGTKFAFINSDAAGDGTLLDAYLVSHAIDNSSASNVTLQFTQNYQYASNSNEFSAVEVWNGSEWVEVLKQEEDIPSVSSINESWDSPVDVTLDLTAYKNANFKVRFHYVGPWSWYWAIDNVVVSVEEPSTPSLYLAGVEVTPENAADLSAIEGVDGTVTYDDATKTLTLEDATINGGNVTVFGSQADIAIYSEIEDLTINLTGNNTLSAEAAGLFSLANTKINGTGSLTSTATHDESIGMVFSGTTTIENCTIDASGSMSGILGNPEIGTTLVMENATVKAKGGSTNEGGSMFQLLNLILNNCAITAPAGAVFDAEEYGVVDADGNPVIEQVVIEPMETYPLYLAGVQVTENNTANLSAIEGVDGTVTYDDATNTLTLEDATINGGNVMVSGSQYNIAIYSEIEDLTINLIGDNTLTAVNAGLYIMGNVKINGTGSLTVNATAPEESVGIAFGGTTIIENCTIDASGNIFGIGGTMELTTLVVDNATVKAKGGTTETGGSIFHVMSISLNGCAITAPADAVLTMGEGIVDSEGEPVIEQVVIEPAGVYDLYLAGVQVTENNAADLSVIDGVDGAVSYDAATKTLTLNNATISGASLEETVGIPLNIALYSGIYDLTIKLVGNNNTTGENVGLVLMGNTKINGVGSLTAKATTTDEDEESAGIVFGTGTHTIENCSIDASGDGGIWTPDGFAANLTIKNATVKATGEEIDDYGSIYGLVSLTLEQCAITAPAGAVFDADENGVVDSDGNLVTEQVIIEPTTGIQDIENMKDIAVYPNPVNNILHVEVSENNFGVELYNIFGQQVLKAQNEHEIYVSELSSGVYVLKITTEKGIYSRKIVKE